MKKITLTILMGISIGLSALAAEPNAKIAELSLHKTEKLVILKKIDASFEIKSAFISVEKITQTQPTDPTFKTTIMENVASNGSQWALTVLQDDTGKPLTFSTNQASDPVDAPNFTPADSLTLMENSLHCVQGEIIGDSQLCANSDAIKSYSPNFKSMTLKALKDSSGTLVGSETELTSSDFTKNLYLRYKLDGTFTDQNPMEIK